MQFINVTADNTRPAMSTFDVYMVVAIESAPPEHYVVGSSALLYAGTWWDQVEESASVDGMCIIHYRVGTKRPEQTARDLSHDGRVSCFLDITGAVHPGPNVVQNDANQL